jgi:hypothetical protein
MSNIIVKGSFPTNLIKGYATKFYGELDMGQDHYLQLFEKLSSDRAFELDVLTDNFTVIPVKPEATNITYQSASQQFTTTYNHTSFGGGFQISKEAKDDGKEMDLMKKYMRNLGFAGKRTNEIRGANVYLRAFNSSYLGGDGVQLIATTHPTKAGNQANTLANQVALSEAALEDLTKLVYKAKDYNGNIAQIRTKQLVVGPNLLHEATRLTASPLRVSTANNDINALKYLNDLPEVVMNPYFESSNLYFLRTDCSDGLKFFERTAPEFSMDSQFDAEVSKYKIFFRNTFYWTDFRGLYGCGNV